MTLLRTIKRLLEMGKANKRPKGKSLRHGNQPSPYTKYQKTPYKYSAAYYDWHRAAKSGKPLPRLDWKGKERKEIREYKMAAE